MRIHTVALAIAATMGASLPVTAQRQQPPAQGHNMVTMHCGDGMAEMVRGGQHAMPGMRPRAIMQGMPEMMGPPTPAMILHLKAELKLDAGQITKLEGLQKEAQPGCTRHMQLARRAHQAANQLLEVATPDFAAFGAKLKEATRHMAQAHVVMAKAAVAARAVLTPAQRQSLQNLVAEMHRKVEPAR